MSSVSVEVDIDDVIDAIDSVDLVDELKSRAKSGDKVAKSALPAGVDAGEPPPITADDLAEMREMAEHGRAHALVSYVANLLCVHRAPSPYVFASLARDPDTGRPVIQ